MGTRNLTAVMIDGEYKIAQYGQWDGYPSGQGVTALNFLRTANLDAFADKVRATRFISEDESRAAWAECGANPDSDFVSMAVANIHDTKYPELSRDTGAKILNLVLTAPPGIGLVNSIAFASNALYCEYAYVIDLDKGTFELYRGFDNGLSAEGERFSNGIRWWKTFPLESLPTEEEFLAATEENEEEAA